MSFLSEKDAFPADARFPKDPRRIALCRIDRMRHYCQHAHMRPWSAPGETRVNFASLLNKDMVSAHLSASTKRQAISKIIDHINGRKGLRNAEEILQAVLRREDALKTALGSGVAIPHARLAGIKEPVVFVATIKDGVAWGAPDGRPVDVIILFLSPAAATDIHLKILSAVGDLMQQQSVLRDIRAARTDAELLRTLTAQEKRREMFVPLSKQEIFQELETTEEGLGAIEIQRRRLIHGLNRLQTARSGSFLRKFIDNLVNVLALLMWVGAALAFLIGMHQVAWAVIAVIFINALFSFWQEYKAERAVEALKGLIPSSANVVREGKSVRVPSAEVFPGDILELAEGDSIVADGRLVQADELRVDNSTFSGESRPVYKISEMQEPDAHRRFLWIEDAGARVRRNERGVGFRSGGRHRNRDAHRDRADRLVNPVDKDHAESAPEGNQPGSRA